MTASFARIRGNLRNLLVVLGALAMIGATLTTTTASAAAASCAALSVNVHERVHPTRHSSALSLREDATRWFESRGFIAKRETSMRMARRAGTGLVAVHRLYRSRPTPDYFYATTRAEIDGAKARGYVDEGVPFYAATRPADCLVPVWSYAKNGVHRFLTTTADAARLAKAGWTKEKVRFYAGRPKADTTFTFAVYPDTQQEVFSNHNGRFRQRSQWLADHRSEYDLRFVTHIGDVVNWDTPDHAQYEVARDALVPLDRAKIPYSLSAGNHDTAAVCAGGSACPYGRTYDLLRDTSTFSRYFNRQSVNREGAFLAGRLDNTYQLYTAGGVGWMVLNLEMWPRTAVLAWAKKVVAAHPKHNVIVVTHSYLTKTGSVSTSADYGDTTPVELSRELVLRYPNIRMVFSGHTGTAAYRVDRGQHGNKVVSMLNCFHSNTTNPVRMVQVDTRANRLKTWVYAPWTKTGMTEYSFELSGLGLVR